MMLLYRYLFFVILALPNVAFSQFELDSTYDPIVPPIPSKKKKPIKTPPYTAPIYDKKKFFILDNYSETQYINPQSITFCKMIVDAIDNIMERNDKVISISIKGFADGLINDGFIVSKKQVCNECLKYITDFSDKLKDIELAKLRACEIDGIIRSLLVTKSYYIYVNVNNNSFYDYEDYGPSGGSYRKVEVEITYLNKKI